MIMGVYGGCIIYAIMLCIFLYHNMAHLPPLAPQTHTHIPVGMVACTRHAPDPSRTLNRTTHSATPTLLRAAACRESTLAAAARRAMATLVVSRVVRASTGGSTLKNMCDQSGFVGRRAPVFCGGGSGGEGGRGNAGSSTCVICTQHSNHNKPQYKVHHRQPQHTCTTTSMHPQCSSSLQVLQRSTQWLVQLIKHCSSPLGHITPRRCR